ACSYAARCPALRISSQFGASLSNCRRMGRRKMRHSHGRATTVFVATRANRWPRFTPLSDPEVDSDVLAFARAEHLRGVAAADGDGDVPVRVLIQDDVARPRVGERARGDGVIPLRAQLELEPHAGQDLRSLQMRAVEVQLHVP